MSDHASLDVNAAILRDTLHGNPLAIAALDALVAERDEAQDKVLAATDYIARAEAAESNAQVFHDEWDKALAERDEARLSLKLSESAQVVFRDRALAAEAEVARLQSGSEIPALRQMVLNQRDTIRAAEAERDNAVAKGQSRLRCWLFGHDWKRREWHVLGTCDRCGKKEAGS